MNPEPYDRMRDVESEARYEDDPRAEPTSEEVKEAAYRDAPFQCVVDESAGFRG